MFTRFNIVWYKFKIKEHHVPVFKLSGSTWKLNWKITIQFSAFLTEIAPVKQVSLILF